MLRHTRRTRSLFLEIRRDVIEYQQQRKMK